MNHSSETFRATVSADRFESVALAARIWATLINVVVTCLAIYVYASIPQFKSLFAGFGAELPALMRIVIQSFSLIWLLLFISLIAQQGLLIALLIKRSFSIRRI